MQVVPIHKKQEPSVILKVTPSKTKGNIMNKNDSVLYKKCRLQLKKICRLKNKIKKMKSTSVLNSLNENETVQNVIKHLTPSFALILQGQLQNTKRKYWGRRWSIDQKIIALRLYKRSATCYRLLRRLWCLPAPSTLKKLLSKFEFKVGINKKVFNSLKKHIQTKQPEDREYILMFDEMAIKKHLWYNIKEDKIEGYQDHGEHGRTQQEATYALVFMVASIRKKIKQPVAFYLSGANVTADRLAVLIKEVSLICFYFCIETTWKV